MKKLLFSLSYGEPYNHRCRLMVESFRHHNPDWETKALYEGEADSILPVPLRHQSPQFKCEIGRWYFARTALQNGYDIVLYSDGDLYWYSRYRTFGHSLTLSPHYITDKAKRDASHWLMKDGVPNLGLIEFGNNGVEVIDKFINEAMQNPAKHYHGEFLWLQNLATYLPFLGYDVEYHDDPGLNVGRWNLGHRDRQVVFEGDTPMVVCKNHTSPLVSFHFSSKSIHSLPKYGEGVKRLFDDYLRRIEES